MNADTAAAWSSSRQEESAIMLMDFPDDVIIKIYGALGLKSPLTLKALRSCEDAFRLSLTCKRAFGLFKSTVDIIDTCYKTPSGLSAAPPFFVHLQRHMGSVLRMFTPLRELHLTEHVVNAMNEADASVLSSIEYIHIDKGFCDYTMVTVWPHVFRMTPKLRKVWLENPCESTVVALVKSGLHLETMLLHGIKTGSIQVIAQFLENNGGVNMTNLAVTAKTTYLMNEVERRNAASWMLRFISFISTRKSTLLPKVKTLSMGMSSPYVCTFRPDATVPQHPDMEATTTMHVKTVMKSVNDVQCRQMNKNQFREREANSSQYNEEKQSISKIPEETVLTDLRLTMEPDFIWNAIKEAESIIKPDTAVLIDIGTAAWDFQPRGINSLDCCKTVRMHIPLLTLPVLRSKTYFPLAGPPLHLGHRYTIYELVLHKRGIFELFEFDQNYRQWMMTFIRSINCENLVISAPLKRWREVDIYVHTNVIWNEQKNDGADVRELRYRMNNVNEAAAAGIDWMISFKMLEWLLTELKLVKRLTISMEIIELCSIDQNATEFVGWLREMKELTHLEFCMPTSVPHADPVQNGLVTVSPAFLKGLQTVANRTARDHYVARKLKVINVDFLSNNIDFDSDLPTDQRIENFLGVAIEAINSLARARPSMVVETIISLLERWRIWELQLDEDEWLEEPRGISNKGVSKVSNEMSALARVMSAMSQSDRN